MKVKKHNLLLLASIIWLFAGFKVLNIGIQTYSSYISFLNISLSMIIFLLFWFLIFSKLTKKHTLRISSYEIEKQYFWNFFDLKSFFIMAFMMTFGILIRNYHLLPDVFIAVFYTGLGTSIFMAGGLFGRNYIQSIKILEKEDTMKKIMNTAIVYFIFAMIGGVFFREFTKFNAFTGITSLSVLHVHLLVLGTFIFLFVAILNKLVKIEQDPLYKKFFIAYNIALPYMAIMFLVRGILQVTNVSLSGSQDAMISGLAGLSHIGIMISLFMLLIMAKRCLIKES